MCRDSRSVALPRQAMLSRNNTDPPCPDSFISEESSFGYPIFTYDLAINLTHDQAVAEITTLQDNHWVDLQTREVRAIFTVYNPGIDLFNNVRGAARTLAHHSCASQPPVPPTPLSTQPTRPLPQRAPRPVGRRSCSTP